MARILSCFIDESGQERRIQHSEKYYLLTLVFHDQDSPIDKPVADYEQSLQAKGLPSIPYHTVDLLHGHKAYENYELSTRKKLLIAFNILSQRLPIQYKTFIYKRSDFTTPKDLSTRMRRDLIEFLYEHFDFFQTFDNVAVYYDGGQRAVMSAVRGAFDYALSVNTAEYKKLRYQERVLAQIADYYCSIELASLKYSDKAESPTYTKFYGTQRAFKANYLKQARRMQMK